jgi:hypothetical protein
MQDPIFDARKKYVWYTNLDKRPDEIHDSMVEITWLLAQIRNCRVIWIGKGADSSSWSLIAPNSWKLLLSLLVLRYDTPRAEWEAILQDIEELPLADMNACRNKLLVSIQWSETGTFIQYRPFD